MKYISEYRSSELINKFVAELKRTVIGNWNIMEVCGGQTHAIYKFGIDHIIPDDIKLIHGPGCPVCVTPVSLIDNAISIALNKDTILCTFGDMMRVPGSNGDFLSARALGADIRIIYSPLEAVTLAQKNTKKEIVFLAIGFETTAPMNGYSVILASQKNIDNYSILNGMLRIPPAIDILLGVSNCHIDALLAPGHVCTVSGLGEYEALVNKYNIPIIATGFEPADIAEGIWLAVRQLERGEARLGNQYIRAVRKEGNLEAQKLIDETFYITEKEWRGLGIVKDSGYQLKGKYIKYDASHKFIESPEFFEANGECIISDILRGNTSPDQCSEFGKLCRPEHPLGPMMVSSEGVCSAYYRYRSKYERKQ
jgi:hydrogenase expression/formation protein HypD